MIVQYRGYWISGSSVAEYSQNASRAEGNICAPGMRGSIVEVKRIKGPTFGNWQEAEEHGLALCKDWLDGLAELFELWRLLHAHNVRSPRFTH